MARFADLYNCDELVKEVITQGGGYFNDEPSKYSFNKSCKVLIPHAFGGLSFLLKVIGGLHLVSEGTIRHWIKSKPEFKALMKMCKGIAAIVVSEEYKEATYGGKDLKESIIMARYREATRADRIKLTDADNLTERLALIDNAYSDDLIDFMEHSALITSSKTGEIEDIATESRDILKSYHSNIKEK